MRQGDSLSDPMRLMLRHPLRSPRHAPALAAARRAAVEASGGAKREALRRLRQVELDTASERFEAAISEREAQVREILASRHDSTLFGERRHLDPRTARALGVARTGLKELRRLRRALREDGAAPSFDFDTQFGDVTAAGGFDLVVGNPPWVRAESLPAPARAQLKERFRWWRTGSGRGYGHQPDLAVAFLERAWELTRPDGVLAMLVPAKVATAAYGAAARTALSEGGTVLAVADLTHIPEASFDATTYPLAIVVRSHRPPADHRPRLGLDPGTGAALGRMTPGVGPWILVPDTLQAALARLRAHPPLSESTRIHLGVKTGANHLFLAPAAEIEEELLRPAVHGKDLRAFLATPSGRIVWTHDAHGVVRLSLPPQASRHFKRHADALRGRSDDVGAVPWSLFRAAAGRPVPRVIWADLARRLEAACLVEPPSLDWVPMNSCYVVLADSTAGALALCAWLNSTWIRAAARATADPASGGFARFNARAVGAVPLPRAALGDERLTALARRGGAGDDVQAELDELVGTWLELRPRDRRALAEVVGVGTERRRRGPASAQGSAGRDPRSRAARIS